MENHLSNLKNNKRSLKIIAAIFLFAGTIALVLYFVYGKQKKISLAPNDQATVMLGKTVYDNSCASCHGAKLEGQANWQTRNEEGKLPAPPHDNTGHTWHHADKMLFDLTKFGVKAFAGEDYKTDMPAFKDTLSDKEIIAVLSYIKSTWPPEVKVSHDGVNKEFDRKNR